METGNRENIITIALDLFSLNGYEGTGVQEIADKAGVSKPTLYHYFGNKRGLLDAIIESYGKKLYDAVNQGALYNHDIIMNLTTLTQALIAYAISNHSFWRFYLTLLSSAPETQGYAACLSLRSAMNERLETLFTEASADHGNMKGRHRYYSETFQGMVKTWAMLVLNKEIELNDETLHRAVHQYMHGIFS
jgi:TetR/AcrR family transcriptional regulator